MKGYHWNSKQLHECEMIKNQKSNLDVSWPLLFILLVHIV